MGGASEGQFFSQRTLEVVSAAACVLPLQRQPCPAANGVSAESKDYSCKSYLKDDLKKKKNSGGVEIKLI